MFIQIFLRQKRTLMIVHKKKWRKFIHSRRRQRQGNVPQCSSPSSSSQIFGHKTITLVRMRVQKEMGNSPCVCVCMYGWRKKSKLTEHTPYDTKRNDVP